MIQRNETSAKGRGRGRNQQSTKKSRSMRSIDDDGQSLQDAVSSGDMQRVKNILDSTDFIVKNVVNW